MKGLNETNQKMKYTLGSGFIAICSITFAYEVVKVGSLHENIFHTCEKKINTIPLKLHFFMRGTDKSFWAVKRVIKNSV